MPFLPTEGVVFSLSLEPGFDEEGDQVFSYQLTSVETVTIRRITKGLT